MSQKLINIIAGQLSNHKISVRYFIVVFFNKHEYFH